jgi:hypothetical protein
MVALLVLMKDDHAQLDALAERLLDHAIAGDVEATRRVWRELERRLLDHMATEEEHLLPELERVDVAEVAALRGDHRRLRRLMAELGAAAGLVEEHSLRQFVQFLRLHATQEEQCLYAWADRHASPGVKATVSDRIGASVELAKRAAGE